MNLTQISSYDAIIIGSGAGGSAAAYRLARAGWRVLLLEKGPVLPRDGSTLDVDKVIRQGFFKSRETWLDGEGRTLAPEEYFNLGGKTKWYGAALLRFSPQEFQADEAHRCLSWPIGYDELAPFYDEAEQLLGVRRFEPEPGLQAIVKRLIRKGGWEVQPLPLALAEHRALVRHFCRSLLRAGLPAIAKPIPLAGTAHACGTLVTGTDPTTSVVDATGKVHGRDNLYVVDGSILPRSSRVNPSVTIYAWALRVAEHLIATEQTALQPGHLVTRPQEETVLWATQRATQRN